MKVLDSTVIIAFLREMDYPEGLRKLASAHQLVSPYAVIGEVRKPPASNRLAELVKDGVVSPCKAPAERVAVLRGRYLDLGPGECECVALWESADKPPGSRLVTDDKRVRQRLPGSHYVWTVELIRYMTRRRLIDAHTEEELLRRLAASSFYYRRPFDEYSTGNRNAFRR